MSNQIDEALGELMHRESVRGAAVVTDDGITVASRLVGRFRDEVVSGLTSFLLLTTRRALSDRESEQRIDRFTIHATHGKLLIQHVGGAWLIVLTDQFARLDAVMPAIDEIGSRVRGLMKIDVS